MDGPRAGASRCRGAAVFALAVFAAVLAPAGTALASPGWQPAISPPAGFSFGGLGPAVSLDAEGDLSTTLKPLGAGPYQYGVRPHAGALGAPQPFPGTLGESAIATRLTAQNAAGDLLTWSSAGNIVGFRPAPIYSTAFGATSFTKVQSLPANAGTLEYASMTPSGAAFAQTLEGDPNAVSPSSKTYVIFRPAGPSTEFDLAQKVALPPAATDTATEPLGIVADADGRVTAVYRSLPSQQAIQISAAPGQPFEGPEQLTLTADPAQWQASAITRIATSYNGHAILVWGTDRTLADGHKTEIWASRRAPGGTFGPRELVADLDSGHEESDADSDYGPSGVNGDTANPELFPVALDSGAALLAFDEITEGDQCDNPATDDYRNGAALVSSGPGGGWSAPLALGANGNVDFSTVDAIAAAGDSVALAYTEGTRSGPCDTSSLTTVTSARVGQGTTLGPPASLGNSGGPGGTGIAVNPAGDAALVLGLPRVLRVYEDPGTRPEDPGVPESPGNPSNPGGGSDPGGVPSGSGAGAATPPADGPRSKTPPPLAAPGGIKLDKPLLVDQRGRQWWFNFRIYCEPASKVSCTVTATPVGAAARPPIKPASGKVAPGRTKALKTYLTPAGIALLAQQGSFKTKVRIVVKAGAAESSAVKTITVKKG